MTKHNVSIGLSNPKSAENVGSVLRASGCFGVDDIYFTGERYARAAKYNTDTKNANQKIAVTRVEHLLELLDSDCKVVCVELVEGAIALPHFEHPEKACYIFGPEDGTLKQEIVDKADAVVYIPTVGCLNLAATVNVVLYDRVAKSDLSFANDALIRTSRDQNNHVKVNSKG
ncbi:23S rRNA methyltransferase [Gammaproteobacteria bacterium 45_16_T64]|nr:23S rRNA methyltransferase [Gammaproteobacteria bacterium 45_16_T64]